MMHWSRTDKGGIPRIEVTTPTGFSAVFLGVGATLASFRAPDRNGVIDDLVLGYDSPEEYRTKRNFFGSTAGRFANRIGKGLFSCEGKAYRLDCNNGPNHLHGGVKGFDLLDWSPEVFAREGSVSVVFTLQSPDGDQGYPGNLAVTATYVLDHDGTLSMEYYAETDALTPVNLTNHAYWNLAGAGSGSVAGHSLLLNCPEYLEFDATQIPTGTILSVDDTPFDFRKVRKIGPGMEQVGGYDHCFVMPPTEGDLRLCAVLEDPDSGRRMRIETTQPGVQFYTGNNLNGVPGRGGRSYEKFGGLCLETQNFPDAVNHPHFPDPFLKPGESYRQKTVHRFSFF